MEKEYKYFGALSVIEEIAKLESLGQTVKLEESHARHVAQYGGVCLLPAELYDSVGVTEQEEISYPTPADTFLAPVAFQHKRDKLWSLWQAWRSGGEDQSLQIELPLEN